MCVLCYLYPSKQSRFKSQSKHEIAEAHLRGERNYVHGVVSGKQEEYTVHESSFGLQMKFRHQIMGKSTVEIAFSV